MKEYAEEIIEDAKRRAIEMLGTDEVICELHFGHEASHLWLTSDRNLIIVDHEFKVGSATFYLGLFKR